MGFIRRYPGAERRIFTIKCMLYTKFVLVVCSRRQITVGFIQRYPGSGRRILTIKWMLHHTKFVANPAQRPHQSMLPHGDSFRKWKNDKYISAAASTRTACSKYMAQDVLGTQTASHGAIVGTKARHSRTTETVETLQATSTRTAADSPRPIPPRSVSEHAQYGATTLPLASYAATAKATTY